jgi:hypothetical protein
MFTLNFLSQPRFFPLTRQNPDSGKAEQGVRSLTILIITVIAIRECGNATAPENSRQYPIRRMKTTRTQAPTEAERITITSATITKTRYRVRQTFFSFGSDCEETFDTTGEAEAYGRAIAEVLAQTFFQASEDYADVPLTSPFSAIGYSNETDFFARLCEDFSISGDGDCRGRSIGVRRKIQWSELVDRICKAAITIEPV